MKRRQALKSFISASILPFLPFKHLFAADECITSNDILGPYFIEGAPNISNIAPVLADIPRLFITGTIYAKDCVTPISNALIDVWQANDDGAYENVDYRGKIYSDESGNYAFESIIPGKYLNGTQYRPSHIHYKVVYKDTEFVTQLYFEGDTSIDIDPLASLPEAEDRIIPLIDDANNNRNGVFDIYLNVEADSVQTPEYERNDKVSAIESLHPNPVRNNLNIQFYNRKLSTIKIDVCDVSGRVVKTLVDKQLSKKVHYLSFSELNLPASLYVIRLFENGQAIDAKRILITD